ncbi:response regulator transcription factor [Gymnodinialimonas sp. 2305UL16-5]|uniref:response regulator transcription factor n=1 Tax=Gymnodinialimonas mytili TaxID=3126503 RepID=UPI00309B0108
MNLLLIDRFACPEAPLATGLAAERMHLDLARGLTEAQAMMAARRYDVALADLSASDGAARRILIGWGAGGPVPLIALVPTAMLNGPVGRVLYLADDWMTKPLAQAELVARIRAVHARKTEWRVRALRAGKLTVSPDAPKACFDGTPLALSARQLEVLRRLMRRSGHPVPRATLEAAAYGPDQAHSANAIEAVVSRLRRSLKAAGSRARIEAVRRVGWRLVIPNNEKDIST